MTPCTDFRSHGVREGEAKTLLQRNRKCVFDMSDSSSLFIGTRRFVASALVRGLDLDFGTCKKIEKEGQVYYDTDYYLFI